MSTIMLDLPEDLAERLRSLTDRLPRILELGLRQLDASPAEFAGASDVLKFLACLPSLEEVLALRPSPALEARVKELLERSRADGLSTAEQDEWQRYEYVEHLVRLVKAKAALKLQS